MACSLHERASAFGARCFGGVLVALWLIPGPAFSQDAGAGQGAPVLPAELVASGIPSDELAYRLIPLTKVELDPLADAWLAIAKNKTEEISERQIALLQDPAQPTDAAYGAITQLVEARADLFGRFSMVVTPLFAMIGGASFILVFAFQSCNVNRAWAAAEIRCRPRGALSSVLDELIRDFTKGERERTRVRVPDRTTVGRLNYGHFPTVEGAPDRQFFANRCLVEPR